MANEIVKKENDELNTVNLKSGNLPDLASAQEIPIDLSSEYWTPETPGEQKRVYFEKVDTAPVRSVDGDGLIELECAFFLEQVGEGNERKIRRITNGSRRLVGALIANRIQPGTPLVITYMGKKKNKSNSFSSDNWSIKPLMINIP